MSRPLHILIVDDDLGKRLLLNRAISREFPHASIFECCSGQEALEYVKHNAVDCLVTDHSMSPVNGIELVSSLRRDGMTIPIVMVTAHPNMKAQAESVGVDLFLSDLGWLKAGKPIADFFKSRGLVDRIETPAG